MSSSHSDRNGYYGVLGIASNAPSEEIKRAYRQLVKKVHPDAHGGGGQDDQRIRDINAAYEVLSDPERRAKYDANCAAQPDSEPNQINPVKCSVCSAISAQPRYVIFSSVFSYLLATSRHAVQGIFCPSCARTKAIKASLITWLFGWWGFPWGPIFSIGALVKNISGGEIPVEANGTILAHQAAYFWVHNRPELASAALRQAQRFYGSADLRDRIDKLKSTIPTTSSTLVDRWSKLRNWGFWVQLSPAIVIAALVLGGIFPLFLDNVSSKQIAYVPGAKTAVMSAASTTAQTVGTVRPFENFTVLVGRGENDYEKIETANGTVGFIVSPAIKYGDGEAALQAACFPLGPEDIANGTILSQQVGGPHQIKVKNGLENDAVVKLRAPDGHTALSFYVKANSEADITSVPEGTYSIDFATGQRFSQTCGYFLKDMQRQKFVDADTFQERTEGMEVIDSVLTVSLNPVADGNAKTEPSDPSDFENE